MKPLLCTLCACLLLAGCGMPSRPATPHHYTLIGALPAASTTPAAAAAHAGAATLQLSPIAAPAWLRGTGIRYRLAYRHDARVAIYTRSDWAAPPATMLTQIIRRALSRTGRWHAVVTTRASGGAADHLQIRLDDFSQVFTGPKQSHAVLEADVTLATRQGDSMPAQRHFRITATAPSADAAGGVQALRQASRDFAHQLQQWLATLDAGQPAPHAKPPAAWSRPAAE